jgi:Domain of unknown function (DUF4381)
MTDEEVLSQLRDIHLPEPGLFLFPLAPGWWIAFLLIALALALFFFQKSEWSKKLKMKHTALQKLKAIENRYSIDHNALMTFQSVSILIKKYAIYRYGAHEVSALTGEEWLKFLDKTGHTHAFTQGLGRAIAEDRFKKNSDVPVQDFLSVTRAWIKAQ